MNPKEGYWITSVSFSDSRKMIYYYFVSSTVMADWFGSVEGFIQCRDKALGNGGEFGIPDLLDEIADNEHEGCHREGPMKVSNEKKSLNLVPGYFIGKLHLGLVK